MSAAFKEQGVMKIQVTTGNLDIQVVGRNILHLGGQDLGSESHEECVNQGLGQSEIDKEERGVSGEAGQSLPTGLGHLADSEWVCVDACLRVLHTHLTSPHSILHQVSAVFPTNIPEYPHFHPPC